MVCVDVTAFLGAYRVQHIHVDTSAIIGVLILAVQGQARLVNDVQVIGSVLLHL